eukprot:Rmarinus@m.8299
MGGSCSNGSTHAEEAAAKAPKTAKSAPVSNRSPRPESKPHTQAQGVLAPNQDRNHVHHPLERVVKRVHLAVMGESLMADAVLNKGTAFTLEERRLLRLEGLLPPRVETLDEQVIRVRREFDRMESALSKYVFMIDLMDTNETLFFKLVLSDLPTMMPIIYTPTVGLACQRFSHVFRRPRGAFISLKDRGNISKILENWHEPDVRVIVVTDGERILGLGDLGINGHGIPMGKLSLYVACAGINPRHCLPITLDVGTNNEEFLKDPMYFGLQQKRERSMVYDDLIEEFMCAVRQAFHHTLIQFEDFGNSNAFRLLEKYRGQYCCFNDDIQGTACVALASIFGAVDLTGKSLTDHKFLFLGAGEAGVGIANLIVEALVAEGMKEADARLRCWFVDSKGLVVKSRTDLAHHKLPYAHEQAHASSFLEAVDIVSPTAIIGVSAQPNTFTEPIIRKMAELNDRPIVFALSNPTSKAECTATQAVHWTDGKVIFASGSPFDPVEHNGKIHKSSQANNAYVFPGIGLGVVATECKHVTDAMFLETARTLASFTSEEDRASGCTLPPLEKIFGVSAHIGVAVAKCAWKDGIAGVPEVPEEDLLQWMQAQQWVPQYDRYV